MKRTGGARRWVVPKPSTAAHREGIMARLPAAPLLPAVRGTEAMASGPYGSSSTGPFENLLLSSSADIAGNDFMRLDFNHPSHVGDTVWVPFAIGAVTVTTNLLPTTGTSAFARTMLIQISAAAAGNGAQVQYRIGIRAPQNRRVMNTTAFGWNTRNCLTGDGNLGNSLTAGTNIRAYFLGYVHRGTTILDAAGALTNNPNYVGFHFQLNTVGTFTAPALVARGTGSAETTIREATPTTLVGVNAVRLIGSTYADYWDLVTGSTTNEAVTREWRRLGYCQFGTGLSPTVSTAMAPTFAYVLDGATASGIAISRFIMSDATT